MISLGQPTHLPVALAANPFYRLIVKFSRYKSGSIEAMFTIEAVLLRYAWLALLVMFGLVLPDFENIEVLSTLVRLSTVVYPFFFIWSLTRISGVELLQLILEGHWTSEVLATPLANRDLTHGFVTPLWITVRRYWLICFFSLALYCLETSVFVMIPGTEPGGKGGHLILDDFVNRAWFSEVFFFSAIAWIVFIYLARLFSEARLRNGLLKGLTTAGLLMAGVVMFGGYCLLLFGYPDYISDHRVLSFLSVLTVLLLVLSGILHRQLTRNFRNYLLGQLGIDLMIYDNVDLHSTAWREGKSTGT